MITDTEKEIEKIFMSYNRVLKKLKLLDIKTKAGNEITHKYLRQAINIMNKKHSSCRWKCQKSKGNKHYLLTEGFYWLVYVYFQREKSQLDADIDFFLKRIKMYEDFLEISSKNFWKNDMYVYELEKYFNRNPETIRKAIRKMLKVNKNYEDSNQISKEGIEWLCKNCFKHKYLELLEEYKMELTEKYIQAGYPYDIF